MTYAVATATNNNKGNLRNLGLCFHKCSAESCTEREKLGLCTTCSLVLYCSVEHQKADWPAHQQFCDAVKEKHAAYMRERAFLEAYRIDTACMPANPFQSAVAQFWNWPGTWCFMQWYYDFFSATLDIFTGEAVEASLAYGLDMLRLNPGEDRVRKQIPALYLRLGRDQKAYNFIKSSAVVDTPAYDWSNVEQPRLKMQSEDPFEDFMAYGSDVSDLSFVVTMTNLKVRLLLDLRGLQEEIEKHQYLSSHGQMQWVRKNALSDILYDRSDIVKYTDHKNHIAGLEQQVAALYDRVKELNEYYWPILHQPELYLNRMVNECVPGSLEEAIVVFWYTRYSWSECKEAIGFIKSHEA